MQLLDRELLQQLGVCKESQKSFHGIKDLMNLCATGVGLAVFFGIQFFVWDSISKLLEKMDRTSKARMHAGRQ